jgi:serine/threonine-protein kinase
MATVYLAHDVKHDRPVALKVLLPELAAALGPERFHREITLAARLQHPHILTVHDSGDAAGQLWYTMPFVEGESLRDRLTRQKQLSLEDALHITRDVAGALDYAHRHGVVHRDVKPENILLTETHALVADFGIARALDSSEQLTSAGIAIGTPAYMSPEQASGTRDVDARADVYALGCVLFEMLAGEPPYTGPTAQAVLARALTETPRPLHPIRPAVPAAVDGVIAKAMAATVADRYASAAEFARALGTMTAPASSQPSPVPAWIARRPLFAMLALGVLLGGGALFAWRQSHRGDDRSRGTFLAVLPFENLGAPEDEYFADGVADEVRGKLLAVPGLQVIASGSANQYKHTTKPPAQIAQELGVQYLLVGKVRWQRTAGVTSRVQVTTELVHVTSGPSTTEWQAPFDAALTDVFQVQAEIASRVVQALDVALGDSSRRRLAEQPTANLAAYDAYLKGEEVSQGLTAADVPTLRRAAAYYAKAVALDSGFAQAWAQWSRAHAILYLNSTPTPADAQSARQAAERALTLAPHRAEGHLAMGDYYSLVVSDHARAADEFRRGIEIAPNHAVLLSRAAYTEESLGHWESALTHMRRAETLDPFSVYGGGGDLTWILLSLRRYPEARSTASRGLTLAPTNLGVIENMAMIALAEGDLAGARGALASHGKPVDPTVLAAFVANAFDLGWLLDEAQQTIVLQLTPDAFDGDRGAWGIALAELYWLRGDRVRAQRYADSARIGYEQQLRETPDDAQRRVFHGLALAYLGRKAEALEEGRRGVALRPTAADALYGPYIQHQLARIYILVGEPELALDQLEPLLRIPYYLSPGWLRIDPNFDPLRSNPRLQRLVAGRS